MKLDKSCGNCRYGQPWMGELRCIRFPPSLVGQTTFPPVKFQWVCGEFHSAAPQAYNFNTTQEMFDLFARKSDPPKDV